MKYIFSNGSQTVITSKAPNFPHIAREALPLVPEGMDYPVLLVDVARDKLWWESVPPVVPEPEPVTEVEKMRADIDYLLMLGGETGE